MVSAALNSLASSGASVLQSTQPNTSEVKSAARAIDNLDFNFNHMPTMFRTSNVSVDFVRQNPQDATLQVELLMKSDIMDMTLNWNGQEKADQRRLVVFNFEKLSLTKFQIDFKSISKSDFRPNLPIISCIYWKEQGFHIVTSVDIVVILEYLIQQSFSIEEKNRIRRNLQSLKPFTVSRNNKKFDRFFSMLMNMEDPRPRNIEKDIKVFKWNDLLNALEKVTSKYSPNLEHKANLKYIKHLPTNQALNIEVSSGPNKAPDRNIPQTHSEEGSNANETTAESSTFLPNERLKVLKRKNKRGNSINQNGTKRKNDLFHHALKPTDPIPLKNSFEYKLKSRDKDQLKDIIPEQKERVENTGEINSNGTQTRSLLHERLPSHTASPQSGSRKSVRLCIPSTSEYHIVSSPGSSGDELLDSENSGLLTKRASISSRSGHLHEALFNNKSSYGENVSLTSPTSTDFKASTLATTPPYRALNTHDYQYPMKSSLYFGDERAGLQSSYGSEPLHAKAIKLPYEVKNIVPPPFNPNLSPVNVGEAPVPTTDLISEKKYSDNSEKPKLPTLSTLLPSLNLTSSAQPLNSTLKNLVPSPLPVYDSSGLYHLPPAQTSKNPSCQKFV